MRPVAWLVLVVLYVGGPVRAEEKDTREYWVYEGRWFSRAKGDDWIEMNEETFTRSGKPWRFKEVGRTKGYVELHDEGRDIKVRLSAGKAEALFKGEDVWKELLAGRWKARAR